MNLTREEVIEWMRSETTVEVLKIIQDEIDANIADSLSGRLIGDTIDTTAQNVCRSTGYVSGLSFIFNITEELESGE